jgi:hypothetical protein
VIKNPIIPVQPHFFGIKDSLDHAAICIFAATGFFLDQDTYFTGLKVLPPATILKEDGSQETWFQWHYHPRDISLKQASEEFAHLFEQIIHEQVGNQRVILPLSGGLDSRTQAAALKHLGNEVNSYGYRFAGGHDETRYGKLIARACDFPFQDWEVPQGYLWNCIDELAKINGCYSEFTHPRSMPFIQQYPNLGDVFSLGHWGDVLFDDMGVQDDLPFDQQVDLMLKKILKKGGQELAEALWRAWGMEGAFMDYLRGRVETLMAAIHIPHSANARIRAFKSLYWAPRWTSSNLPIFEAARPITLPYYDDRMCQFICTVPEQHLAGRQIQIEYLKMRAPELARIPWQDHRPFNLYNYRWDTMPWNFPYRVFHKMRRSAAELIGEKLIQRNWELQFLGEQNDQNLRNHLFGNEQLSQMIPEEIIKDFYSKFMAKDPVKYSHAVSNLLTLSVFKRLEKVH